jgi:hypothetical protein
LPTKHEHDPALLRRRLGLPIRLYPHKASVKVSADPARQTATSSALIMIPL